MTRRQVGHGTAGRRRVGFSLLLSAFLHLLFLLGYHLLTPSPTPDQLPFVRRPQALSPSRLAVVEPNTRSPAMERFAGRLPDLSLDADAISSAVSDSVKARLLPGDASAGPIEVGGRHLPLVTDSIEIPAHDDLWSWPA